MTAASSSRARAHRNAPPPPTASRAYCRTISRRATRRAGAFRASFVWPTTPIVTQWAVAKRAPLRASPRLNTHLDVASEGADLGEQGGVRVFLLVVQARQGTQLPLDGWSSPV